MQVTRVQTLSECWVGILLWVQWFKNESKLTQKERQTQIYKPKNCEPSFNHFLVGKLCFYHALLYWHPTTIPYMHPKWTSTREHATRDGWYVDRTPFFSLSFFVPHLTSPKPTVIKCVRVFFNRGSSN